MIKQFNQKGVVGMVSNKFIESGEEINDFPDELSNTDFHNLNHPIQNSEIATLKDILGPSVFETYKKNKPENIVIHVGSTNTGKTHHALLKLKKSKNGLYLAPLRLLALEVFERLNNDNIPCSLKTGEEEVNVDGSTHTSSTVEMCRLDKTYDLVVIDECQMMGDEERGSSWVRAILGVQAREIHLITSPEALNILGDVLNDKNIEIVTYHRETEIKVLSEQLGLKKVEKGDAVVAFSRLNVLTLAKQLENKGFNPAIIYGSMPPSVRKRQVEQFQKGVLDVIVTTDAIGMGMNLPIKRVLFYETTKFDGKTRRPLTTSELTQIGGRAGRKGMFDIGYVGFMENVRQAKQSFLAVSKSVDKIVITPTFEMFVRFFDQMEFSCEVQAIRNFIKYWRTYKPIERFVKVSPMNNQLALANRLSRYDDTHLFTLEQVWKFIHIPVNSEDQSTIDVWYKAIKAVATDQKYELQLKNINKMNHLEELEIAYKKIDVLLSFLPDGDVNFRYYDPIKKEIEEKIFEILQNKIKKLTKKCKHCSKRLPLTYEYQMCQKCYNLKYAGYYYEEW